MPCVIVQVPCPQCGVPRPIGVGYRARLERAKTQKCRKCAAEAKKKADGPRCRHCGSEKVTRPRGLGWKCYYEPAIRALYPPDSKFAPRDEPTEEELERMIAEQLPTMPAWGPDDE